MKQQTKQKRSKRKRAVIASVLALALILSGTYAYQAISEAALNELYEGVNPGGRLHDDYDGRNKDIYVENFGQVPIMVRVRLDEFLEIGGNIIETANSGSSGTVKRDKPETWTTYIPFQTDLTKNVSNGNCDLTLGGQKWFMPTFNKSNGNLNPDQPNPRNSFDSTIDGFDPITQEPWLGIDPTDIGNMPKYGDVRDGSYEDDLVTAGGTPEEAIAGYWDPGVHDDKTAKELIWDRQGNGGTGETVESTEETHNTAQTKYAQVISMEQWKARGNKLSDEYFWVYDTDGWAYWSLPLYPGETTGLLLDSITFNYAQEADWYYAINAVAQFATVDNWATEFGTADASQTAGKPTTDGEALLEKASYGGVIPGTTFVDVKSNVTWRVLARDKLGNLLIILNDVITAYGAPAYQNNNANTFINYATANPYIKTYSESWYTSNAGLLADYDLKWAPENIPLERYSVSAWPTPPNNFDLTWRKALSTAGSTEATTFTEVIFPLSISEYYEYGSKDIGGTNANPGGTNTLNNPSNTGYNYWLRSPGNSNAASYANANGSGVTGYPAHSSYGAYYRPALWVKHLPIA